MNSPKRSRKKNKGAEKKKGTAKKGESKKKKMQPPPCLLCCEPAGDGNVEVCKVEGCGAFLHESCMKVNSSEDDNGDSSDDAGGEAPSPSGICVQRAGCALRATLQEHD